MPLRELKRATIREEFVAIAGNYVKALILDRLLFYDYESSDWETCSAEYLINLTMLDTPQEHMEQAIRELAAAGLVECWEEKNYFQGKKLYCQINISNVVDALDEKGYALEGYKQVGENEYGI
jgi:hypothetical protein